MMSSLFTQWPHFAISNGLHLIVIFVLAWVLNRFLRRLTGSLTKPADSHSRAAQAREQQTRALASILEKCGSSIVWIAAAMTALPEVGITVVPAVVLGGVSILAVGLGAQNTVRDLLAGFQIVFEDQYVSGDTIQVGDVSGRVEYLNLRRTVVRDSRGALVTLANGDIRCVSNLSRDWSQAFVDVSIAPETPLEKVLPALEAAAADLRNDASWSQALVDGPRILGLQSLDQAASIMRLQVRTTPTRQEEVSRELRRRIQIEFQRRCISRPAPQEHIPVAADTSGRAKKN